MGIINVLDIHVANLIAAGEVVDPAAIVVVYCEYRQFAIHRERNGEVYDQKKRILG